MSNLTRREQFAMAAMKALLEKQAFIQNNTIGRQNPDFDIAREAVKLADEMEEALSDDHAWPVPDSDGWIKHNPGDPIPCDIETMVDVKSSTKEILRTEAGVFDWGEIKTGGSILKWRPHKKD